MLDLIGIKVANYSYILILPGHQYRDKSRGPAVAANCSKKNAVSGVLLAALLHDGDKKGEQLISAIANKLKSRGYRVGDVVQTNLNQSGQCRCDMVLEELTSGRAIPISQNLGNQSRGCRLDSAALEQVVGLVETSIHNGLDILVLNKFGSQEAEGRGLRNAIAIAVNDGIPVLVGLNRGNVEAWKNFCGGEGQMLEPITQDVEYWLRSALQTVPHLRQVADNISGKSV